MLERWHEWLAFTRYCFTLKLLGGSHSLFHFEASWWESFILSFPPHLQSLHYCNTTARLLRNTRPPPPTPGLYAIHHTLLEMAILCKGQTDGERLGECASFRILWRMRTMHGRQAASPDHLSQLTFWKVARTVVAPPSSVVKCLWEVFVWGFGVLFLSCACVCVSLSGVLFSVGVCVCDLLIFLLITADLFLISGSVSRLSPTRWWVRLMVVPN